MKTAQVIYTITGTIKQKVGFRKRMHREMFYLDRIQNGRQSATIYLNRPDIR